MHGQSIVCFSFCGIKQHYLQRQFNLRSCCFFRKKKKKKKQQKTVTGKQNPYHNFKTKAEKQLSQNAKGEVLLCPNSCCRKALLKNWWGYTYNSDDFYCPKKEEKGTFCSFSIEKKIHSQVVEFLVFFVNQKYFLVFTCEVCKTYTLLREYFLEKKFLTFFLSEISANPRNFIPKKGHFLKKK